jgi:hypothetical protein
LHCIFLGSLFRYISVYNCWGFLLAVLGPGFRALHLPDRHSVAWTKLLVIFKLVIFEVLLSAQASLDYDTPVLCFPLSLEWKVCHHAQYFFSVEMESHKLFGSN